MMSKKQTTKQRSSRSKRERELILQAKEGNAWMKSVMKTLTKMEELAITPALHGEIWKEKTGRYYKERLRQMIAVAPRSVEKKVPEMRKRLEALPW